MPIPKNDPLDKVMRERWLKRGGGALPQPPPVSQPEFKKPAPKPSKPKK